MIKHTLVRYWPGLARAQDILKTENVLVVLAQLVVKRGFFIGTRFIFIFAKMEVIKQMFAIMVLIANLNWRNLTGKVLSSHDSKNNRVPQMFSFTDAFELGLVRNLFGAELLIKGRFRNWHDSLYVIVIL